MHKVGLFIGPIISNISNTTPDTGPFAFLGQNSTSQLFRGVGVGAYYDFFHSGAIEAGADLRGSILRSNGAQLNSLLVGARIAYNVPNFRLKPYIEPLVGLGSSKAPTNTLYASKPTFGVSVGVDYALNKHVDFRVLEVGVESVQTINSGLFGGTVAFPSSKMLNFSTGLVFVIP